MDGKHRYDFPRHRRTAFVDGNRRSRGISACYILSCSFLSGNVCSSSSVSSLLILRAPSVKPENDLEKRHSSRPFRSRLAKNTPCLRSCTKPSPALKHTGGPPVFLFYFLFFAFHAASPLLHSTRQQALGARSKNDDPFSTHYIFYFFSFFHRKEYRRNRNSQHLATARPARPVLGTALKHVTRPHA